MDLVRPLGLAGVRCAVVAPPREPVRYSRFATTVVEWADPWTEAETLVDRLLEFGRGQNERPVLYYEEDRDLLMVSRYREPLAEVFRFVIAERELVEDLVDKARFQALAERIGLPVPVSRTLPAGDGLPRDLDLRFPIIVKPLTREGFARWAGVSDSGKALSVGSPERLLEVWPELARLELDLLAQELVPGPETRIESYHAYVDEQRDVVAEFTGRKIRTRPAEYGFSTALELTDARDVAALGRELTRALGATGVMKLDFKRGPDGRLTLLEVNPRFNLWHHLGAKAGVNLPALVYADVTGRPRPPIGDARAGRRWCFHVHDGLAAREQGVPLASWVRSLVTCEAVSTISLDDPMPFVRGVVWKQVRKRLARA